MSHTHTLAIPSFGMENKECDACLLLLFQFNEMPLLIHRQKSVVRAETGMIAEIKLKWIV